MAHAAKNATWAAQLMELHTKLLAQYNQVFYKGGGKYDTDTQTALALGLALGAAKACSATNQTQAALLSAVSTRGTHSYTGIIGSSELYPMLDAAGAHDTALAVLSQTAYPSFGFAFANSLEKATTNLWELPDAPAEGTGMNSRNHHMASSYSA
jgi:alpha-L-rhamnosidase